MLMEKSEVQTLLTGLAMGESPRWHQGRLCLLWAEVDAYPDGICIDAAGAVWYADVPNKRCVRVREGGEVLETINLDRGCFACSAARVARHCFS
jgi:sugar lactone lactonase YvrE